MPENSNPKLRTAPKISFLRRRIPQQPFAELLVTTNFSFLRGASHPDELTLRAAELGYKAIGIADRNSFAGIVRMHVAAKELDMRVVIGTRLLFEDHPPLAVYPINRKAYGELCKLLTLGKRRAEKGECKLYIEDFLAHSKDIHAVIIPPEKLTEEFALETIKLRSNIGNKLSIAASCTYELANSQKIDSYITLSKKTSTPLLATNDVYYHIPRRRYLQDVLTCIREGCTINDAGFKLSQNSERYLKTPAQIAALFSLAPRALERGLEIAEECTFNLSELRYEYPNEVTPVGLTAIEYLTQLAREGAKERYPGGVPEKVSSLISKELKLIQELKIEAYFLTVYDLVRFARSKGILCQGRGSAANSAVCYCIGVTSVDPSRIEVLFERFVSAARNEPPDIDVDFEHERREEVIQYVYEKFGRERSGMTAVVTTYRGRSAVRDVGKALGLALDTVDQMAKKLDWWDKGTILESRLKELGLNPKDRTIRMVIALTSEIIGFPRHLSQHVGGMVMTNGLLSELVPIENASMEDRTVIEWDKQDIDDLGILKVDILALGMLTCIAKCITLINETRAPGTPELFFHTIPAEDPATYQMIQDADTIGVFQIESRAQMSMLPRLKPKEFYDLIIEVAIVRPGPIQGDMVHPYLKRRDGKEAVTYPSEALKEVLKRTLGVPLFQEQAMKVAMVGAGFSGDEADKLRRAMAAWRRTGALENFHKKIISGMLKNGYSIQYAEQCFNQLKGFSEYGFPESHAASFALLVYVSSWIKRHHPEVFCCALLNSQPLGFYAPAQLVRDALTHSVSVSQVDINKSNWDCTLEEPSNFIGGDVVPKWDWGCKKNSVRLGFRMIRGMSKEHAEIIQSARNIAGHFNSIDHFWQSTHLPSHVLRRLAKADAFQSLGLSRREALWHLMKYRNESLPLFDYIKEKQAESVILAQMPISQEVTTDYQSSGLSLKHHPLTLVREELTRMKITPAKGLLHAENGMFIKVAGLVLIRQRPSTASGIVFETIEDETGIVNLIIRPNIYDQYRQAARHATMVLAIGNVERQGKVVHVMVKEMEDLSSLVFGCEVGSRDFH